MTRYDILAGDKLAKFDKLGLYFWLNIWESWENKLAKLILLQFVYAQNQMPKIWRLKILPWYQCDQIWRNFGIMKDF